MGKEVKRVPLDFNWPLNMVWKGYISPYRSQECTICKGSGYSSQAQHLYDQWYGNAPFYPAETGSPLLTWDTPAVYTFAKRNVERDTNFYLQFCHTSDMGVAIRREAKRLCEMWNSSWGHHLEQSDVDALLEHNRLWDFTRVPRTPEQVEIVRQKQADGGNSWLPFENGYRPTAAEVNEWNILTPGHDSLNAGICVAAKCERLGYPVHCPFCEGHGSIWFDDHIRELADKWYTNERYDPPLGDGWQTWETVSEGSPISPVFATSDDLIVWLMAEGYSEEAARKFVAVGWVMSAGMKIDANGVDIRKDIESLTLE